MQKKEDLTDGHQKLVEELQELFKKHNSKDHLCLFSTGKGSNGEIRVSGFAYGDQELLIKSAMDVVTRISGIGENKWK